MILRCFAGKRMRVRCPFATCSARVVAPTRLGPGAFDRARRSRGVGAGQAGLREALTKAAQLILRGVDCVVLALVSGGWGRAATGLSVLPAVVGLDFLGVRPSVAFCGRLLAEVLCETWCHDCVSRHREHPFSRQRLEAPHGGTI